jgi:hypothetical protein
VSGAEPNRGAVEPLAVSPPKLIAASALVSVLVVAIYLAAGGGTYEPTAVADPCAPREWTSPEGPEETAQQIFLSTLDGAACELGVSREALAVGLATEESRAQFATEQGLGAAEFEIAIRAGVVRAIDDAENAAVIAPFTADALRAVVIRLPLDELIGLVYNATAILGDAGGLLP